MPEETVNPGNSVPAIWMALATTKSSYQGEAEAFAIRMVQSAGRTYYRECEGVNGTVPKTEAPIAEANGAIKGVMETSETETPEPRAGVLAPPILTVKGLVSSSEN